MRAFVAVRPSAELREKFAEIQRDIQADMKVRWTRPDNIHVTLKFLGEISEEQTGIVREKLREMAKRHSPFSLEFAGVGTFGNRVVWVGCREGKDALLLLAADAEACGEAAGVPKEERPFQCHLTVGRPKGKGKLVIPDDLREQVFGAEKINSILLLESTLRPEGAIYEEIESYFLGG